MQLRHGWTFTALLAATMVLAGCREDQLEPTASSLSPSRDVRASQVPSMYVADFVASAATGWDLNDGGDVVGRSYTDPGCGAFCLPPEEIAVWRGGNRIVLPLVPGFSSSYQFPFFINNQGQVGGIAGIPGSMTHAAVWTPNGASYTVQDLGVFPGTSSAEVAGIDDQGRMVGWSTLGGAIPTLTVPFMWSPATGMVDLKAQGYPNERPAAMSPGGKVVTWNFWYQLGNPASAVPLPATPRGFVGAGSNGSAINDAGDQAHFLVSTGTQNLVYPFRLPNGGTWQMISSAGTGHLSRSGMGSINSAQDISFTVQSTGMIAPGPAGLGQPLAPLLSPAYPGATVGDGGAMNNAGQILTQVMIGRSQRLMKLTPAVFCGSNCVVVSSLVMTGQFVQDPAFPGSCFQGGKMYNLTTATATVTSETGAPLGNVQVSGRFLDDYWTNRPVTGTTNASGVVTWTHQGLCGVGAIAFLVDNATLGTRTFDRTRGIVTNWVIPSTTPSNQPPVASFTRSCNSTNRTCSFNGTGSTDDVGIVSYGWTFGDGSTGTGATPSHTYAVAGSYPVTLTVTDGGGLTSSLTRTVKLSTGTNQPPVAAWTVSCQPAPAHTCTFTGTGSSDPDGTIVSYKWTNATGNTLSTVATFTRTFLRSLTLTWTLTVTDNGGKINKLSKTFTVP
jgi:PKD repeat protein